MKRGSFLKNTAIVSNPIALASCEMSAKVLGCTAAKKDGLPIVISTWNDRLTLKKQFLWPVKSWNIRHILYEVVKEL